MGANGCRPQEKCWRGHPLGGVNSRPATGGGRRCVACNRALSIDHNRRKAGYPPMSADRLDLLADQKYVELVPSARCQAATYTNNIKKFIIRCRRAHGHTGSHV